MRCCSKCGRSDVRLDVYNDFGDHPGDLICDPCVYAAAMAADPRPTNYAPPPPPRPEGYYHCAPGTFD